MMEGLAVLGSGCESLSEVLWNLKVWNDFLAFDCLGFVFFLLFFFFYVLTGLQHGGEHDKHSGGVISRKLWIWRGAEESFGDLVVII